MRLSDGVTGLRCLEIWMSARPHTGTMGPDLWWWDLGACNLKSFLPDDSNDVVA